MQFLIDNEIYLFKAFTYDSNDNLYEYDEESLLKKILEEKEKIKIISPILLNLFESALNNFVPVLIDNKDLYFLKLDDDEKKFIKIFHKNFNRKIQLKLPVMNLMKFKNFVEDNKEDKYVISLYKNTVIDFTQNKISFETNMILMFEDKYNLLLGKKIYNRKNWKKMFLFKKLQLKDIKNSVLRYIFSDYFKYLEKENPIMNEITEDLKKSINTLNVPIDFELLKVAKNKKELLELKFKKSRTKYMFYNFFNKISLNGAYSLIKVSKYLNEKEIFKYNKFDYFDFEYDEKHRIKSFLMKFVYNNIKNKSEIKSNHYLEDYIDCIIKLKGKHKINLDITTYKKLIKEHDKIYKIYIKEKFKRDKLVIKEDNKFLKLELPKDIKILNTKKKLFDEGEVMQHCAYSYLPYINNESCMLYTYLKDDKRYTIEIVQKGKNFILNQLKGYKNSDPPKEVVDYVKSAIKKANIKLLESKEN